MAEEPTPPTTLPTQVVEGCSDLRADQLWELATYAETLAAHREREERRDEETPSADDATDRPADVPTGASVTVKEINDNRYRYWQWRDGDKIKSRYIGPVDPSE